MTAGFASSENLASSISWSYTFWPLMSRLSSAPWQQLAVARASKTTAKKSRMLGTLAGSKTKAHGSAGKL